MPFRILIAIVLSFAGAMTVQASDVLEIRPFLEAHCLKCHGGDETKGDVDFSEIKTMTEADRHPDLWETVAIVLEEGEMPPKKATSRPSDAEKQAVLNWIENDFFGEIESMPGVFKPRRLSGPEYRNTMRSLFGFDLEVNIAEAEQTVAEKSLVLKLLPTDPPGASGFVNDTHTARISTTIFDQYSYLADFALEELFSNKRKAELAALVGSNLGKELTAEQARQLMKNFTQKAYRRPFPKEKMTKILANMDGKSGNDLIAVLKTEMKTVLMSPGFLYRGHLNKSDPEKNRQPVDDFEFAERLSYFLWEDAPDEQLFFYAAGADLTRKTITLEWQIDRMLESPKSRSLAESFGSQWLLLDQIRHDRKDPPNLHALQTQPLDFLHYLFTKDRPVMELIDSDVTFANAYTGGFYGNDRKQLKKFIKPKGIERMAMPNQKINLVESRGYRGGIITMPGVLGMNEGPILRGTWMLRQILGEHLGEPPPDVPPIQAAPKGKKMTFRERFEQHRADESCALCHDKIDPLGFALEGYNRTGGKIGKAPNTSGQLPTGQEFADFAELKEILLTDERETIVRNSVERMLSYALCRTLERGDRPTVDELTEKILKKNGTWRDLIVGIANSVPFREMRLE